MADEIYGDDDRFNRRDITPYRLRNDNSASMFNQRPPARDFPRSLTTNIFLRDVSTLPRTRTRIRYPIQYYFAPERPVVERTLRVQLNDVRDGNRFTVTHPYKRICPTCKGDESGMLTQETCNACRSHGRLRAQNERGIMQCDTCNQCNGSSGRLINVPCTECHGQITTTERSVTFVIPMGHPMDQPIIFEEEAGVLGDLVVNFQVIS